MTGAPAAPGAHSVTVTNDLVYATVDDIALGFDLYLPATDAPPPLVVYVHGGAWKEGDKSADGQTRLAALASHGIAVASINYRLIGEALFPAGLHDVKGAVRWFRSHGAELGVASGRIGIWGASSGAHLASLAALTPNDPEWEGGTGGNADVSSEIDAVVHWFGPVDLVNNAHRSWLEKILLAPPLEPPIFGAGSIDDVVGKARAASPLNHVRVDAPPFLIAHGDRDRVLPRAEGEAFHDALSRAGARSTLQIIGGAGHEDHAFDEPANLAMTAAFFAAHLAPHVAPAPATQDAAVQATPTTGEQS